MPPGAMAVPAPPPATEDSSGDETVSQANARRKAADYPDFSAFSRSGLIEQLEFEGFSQAESEHGADSVGL